MGICSSCNSTSISTAKLVLHDGRLQEFTCPVKVAYVLQKNPTFFICNSDDMEFDDVVSAVSDDDLLQLGQLYFALPLSRLKRRLTPEEMAALAVKASSALSKSCSGGDRCGCRQNSLLFSCEKKTGKVVDSGGVGLRRGRSNGGGCDRRSGKFTAMLSAIPE